MSAEETPEPAGADSPEDAVAWVRSAADAVNTATLRYDTEDWRDAVRLLQDLRKATTILSQVDAVLTRWIYLHGEHGIHLQVEGVPGNVAITRGRSKERWNAEAGVKEYVGRKVQDLGGEFPDPDDVVRWVLEVLPATSSTSLRKTPLREAGLDVQDFYVSEPGTIRVDLPKTT